MESGGCLVHRVCWLCDTKMEVVKPHHGRRVLTDEGGRRGDPRGKRKHDHSASRRHDATAVNRMHSDPIIGSDLRE